MVSGTVFIMRYYINIGTNLGDREANIEAALAALRHSDGCSVAEVSHAVTSAAWGYESGNDFLNVAVAVDSTVEPKAMLERLKGIEDVVGSRVHRDAAGGYCDRIIDLDIMAIDEQVIDMPELHVPHCHLAERTFFVEPVLEIAPSWHHPGTGASLAEMLCCLRG